MNIPETLDLVLLPNPLSSARLVSRRTKNADYRKFDISGLTENRRGDKRFIMSRSELFKFERCPNRWRKGYRDDDTGSTEWGSLLDAVVFRIDPVIKPPENYNRVKKYKNKPDEVTVKPWTSRSDTCKEWEDAKREEGFIVSTQDEWEDVQEAKGELRVFIPEMFHPTALDGIQVMLLSEYRDADTGLVITLKHLIDWLPERKVIWDLKSAACAAPGAFENSIGKFGYHWQSAMEMDAANLAFPDADYCEFRAVVQENYSPWTVEEMIFSEEWINLGRMEYLAALKLYCQCLSTNTWPGYKSRDMLGRAHVVHPKPYQIGL